ncbi:MAG: PEGA domain-containing protein [Vicinamibacterales bacterium]
MPIRRPIARGTGARRATAAGDRFSLAALAYEWATGRRPASTFVPGDMAPVAGGDRDALGLVFGRALHADPDARFGSNAALVDALSALVSPLEDEAPRASRKRSRGPAASPVPLPLQDFPEEHPDSLGDDHSADAVPHVSDDGDDDLALVPHSGPAWDPEPEPVRARVPEPETEPEPERTPVAAGPFASVADDDLALTSSGPAQPAPAPALGATWDEPRVVEPAPRRSRSWIVAAAIVGLAIGVGVGWAVRGRNADPTAVEMPAAPDAQPSSPAVIEDPQPIPIDPSTGATAPPDAGAPGAPAAGAPATTPRANAPAPAAPPARTSGSLQVRSTPAGASVFVDGLRRGVTPLRLDDVPLGTRQVRLLRDGFAADERRVTLTAERPSGTLDVRLQASAAPAPRRSAAPPAATSTRPSPAAATGTLLVESRPAGAAVTVDGRPVGQTPVTVERLAPGTHTVSMVLSGYRPVSTTVPVGGGERARAAASLTLQEPR